MAYVASGPYITGHEAWDGSIVLQADHRQLEHFVRAIATHFKIRVVAYGPGTVPGIASADRANRVIRFDRRAADRFAVLHGAMAVEFIVLHEMGHLRFHQHGGRRGEQLADQFAAEVMAIMGYRVDAIVAAAAASLAGTAEDGVHDAGDVRLRAIRAHAARTHRR